MVPQPVEEVGWLLDISVVAAVVLGAAVVAVVLPVARGERDTGDLLEAVF